MTGLPHAPIDWNAYAHDYDTLVELIPYREMLGDAARMMLGGAAPILDAGCGTGNMLRAISETVLRDAEMIGIDASREMLARAREKCPHAAFLSADLDAALPFPDGQFGTVLCVNVLYAVADPLHTLREYRRVLRYGGALTVVTPKDTFENGLILKAHCGSVKPDAYWRDAHRSPEREAQLLHEAIADELLEERMRRVAAINRTIASTAQFHFLSEAALRQLMLDAGFRIGTITETYARQAHLAVAYAS